MDLEAGGVSRLRRAVAVLALGGALALIGFGRTSAELPAAAAASPARIHVRFWHMWTAEWKAVVDRIVARFNASQTEYWVDALSVPPTGAESKFLLAVVGGDPPDVMAQWQYVIPTWAKSGMLTPLDGLMSEADKQTFEREAYPVAKKIGAYSGKLYGMPIGINAWACYYRKDHLREAGIDPQHLPATLEGLVELGRKLDRSDEHGNLTQLGFLPQGLKFFAPLFDGGFYDESRQQLLLDSPANRRALEYLVAERKRLGFERVTRFDSAQNAGFGLEWPFASGSVSMTLDGQWRIEQLAKYAPQLEYGVIPLPPPQGGQTLAGFADGNFMIVPHGAKHSAGAWALIRFWSGLADPERAAELFSWGGWLPGLKSVAQAAAFRAYLRKYPQLGSFLELLPSPHLQTLPPVPFQTFVLDRIVSADDAASRGDLSPPAALGRLEVEVSEEQARRRSLGDAE
jgi:multiple sugar transport system substrate-binding protein